VLEASLTTVLQAQRHSSAAFRKRRGTVCEDWKVAPTQFDAGKLTAPKETRKRLRLMKEEDLPRNVVGWRVAAFRAASGG